MHTAMDVRVLTGIVKTDGVNNLSRALGRSRIVKIDQWMAVHDLAQNRKIISYLMDIK